MFPSLSLCSRRHTTSTSALPDVSLVRLFRFCLAAPSVALNTGGEACPFARSATSIDGDDFATHEAQLFGYVTLGRVNAALRFRHHFFGKRQKSATLRDVFCVCFGNTPGNGGEFGTAFFRAAHDVYITPAQKPKITIPNASGATSTPMRATLRHTKPM